MQPNLYQPSFGGQTSRQASSSTYQQQQQEQHFQISRTLSKLLHGGWWFFVCQSPFGRHAVFPMYSLAFLASERRRRSAVDRGHFCFFSQGMSHSYCQHRQDTPGSSPKVVQDFQGGSVVPELGSPDLMQHAKHLHALCGANQVQHSCPQRRDPIHHTLM